MFQSLFSKLGYVPVSLLNQEKKLTEQQAKIINVHEAQAKKISDDNLRYISQISVLSEDVIDLSFKVNKETKQAKELLRKNKVLLRKQGEFKEKIKLLESDLHQMGTDTQNQDRIISELQLELLKAKEKISVLELDNSIQAIDIDNYKESLSSIRKQKEDVEAQLKAQEEETKELLIKLPKVIKQAEALPYATAMVQKLQEKIEYLCFGNVLSRSLRPSSLMQYQHLYKPKELEWREDGVYFLVDYTAPTVELEVEDATKS